MEALKELGSRVNVPIIASGGCGTTDHFTEVFREAKVDAALAASVFHFGEIEIPELKKELENNGIATRRI
jgi:cyclase